MAWGVNDFSGLEMPPGQGTIRIDPEGAWSYKGVEITRRDLIAYFYRNLCQDESGHYFIEIGRQRCDLDVADTAYVVWTVRWDNSRSPGESVRLHLSDDSFEDLDPATLRIGRDNVLYCRVKQLLFEARFSRSGYYQLVQHIQYDPDRDACFLSLGGQRHYIADSMLGFPAD